MNRRSFLQMLGIGSVAAVALKDFKTPIKIEKTEATKWYEGQSSYYLPTASQVKAGTEYTFGMDSSLGPHETVVIKSNGKEWFRINE